MNRIVWRNEESRNSQFLYPVIWATTMYGVGFVIFTLLPGTPSSSLYAALDGLNHVLPTLWGMVAAVGGAGSFLAIYLRRHRWLKFTSILSMVAWGYGLIAYIFSGYWLVVVAVALPSLWLWVLIYLGESHAIEFTNTECE